VFFLRFGSMKPLNDTACVALAPEYPFPTQLRQALAAIEHLLGKGLSPFNIIAGDPAGGNLVFQVASQMQHPHTSLPTVPLLQEPFAGLL
jgi:acetyl esterase/lipase